MKFLASVWILIGNMLFILGFHHAEWTISSLGCLILVGGTCWLVAEFRVIHEVFMKNVQIHGSLKLFSSGDFRLEDVSVFLESQNQTGIEISGGSDFLLQTTRVIAINDNSGSCAISYLYPNDLTFNAE